MEHVWLLLDQDGNKCHIIEEESAPSHWRNEHDSPHCYACRKSISPDSPVALHRTENRLLWYHGWCGPDAPDKRFFEFEK